VRHGEVAERFLQDEVQGPDETAQELSQLLCFEKACRLGLEGLQMGAQLLLDDGIQAAEADAEVEKQPDGDQGGGDCIEALDDQGAWGAVETIVLEDLHEAQLDRLGEHLAADAGQGRVRAEECEHMMPASRDEGSTVLILEPDVTRREFVIVRDGDDRLSDLVGTLQGGKGGCTPYLQDDSAVYDHPGRIQHRCTILHAALWFAGGSSRPHTPEPEDEAGVQQTRAKPFSLPSRSFTPFHYVFTSPVPMNPVQSIWCRTERSGCAGRPTQSDESAPVRARAY